MASMPLMPGGALTRLIAAALRGQPDEALARPLPGDRPESGCLGRVVIGLCGADRDSRLTELAGGCVLSSASTL